MSFWHQAPFVRLVLPLVTGIIVAAFLPFLIPFSLPLILGLTIIFLFLSFLKLIHTRYLYRWIYGAFMSLLFFIYGYEITVLNTEKLLPHHYSYIHSKGDKIIAMVAEPTVAKEKSLKAVLEVKAIIKDKRYINSNGKILVYIQKDSISEKIQYGNLILFYATLAEISPPQNPSEFNYKQFLSFHRVYQQVYLKNNVYRILDDSPRNNIIGFACGARNYLMKIFEKYKISGNEYSVASALMLGSREEIDKELVQAYSSSGALHVLSVSGLHVGVIFIVMTYILIFLDKMKYGTIIKTILLLFGLWFYAILTGLSPSVVRAATMFSFVVVGKAGKWNTNIYNILACSAFFLLLINPYLIMEVGFQLSYLAVIGIVFIQPKLNHLWDPYIPIAGKFGNWIITQVWAITTVSIAAQLATFALGLLYFHQFPNYFLFSNLVVIPLSTLIIYCGVLLFVVSPFEFISEYIAVVFKECIVLLNKSVVLVEQLPYSLLQGISISLVETWLIYILIILMLSFFILQKIKFARYFFIILIFLLAYQIFESHLQRKQKKFVVYNISKTSAIDFIDGRKNYLLSDSSFINNESRILFHVRHHWWDLGLRDNLFFDFQRTKEIKGKNLFLQDGFAQFHEKRFAFINKNFNPFKTEKKTKLDYIIISGSPGITVEKLKECFEVGMIIIDASNAFYATEKLIQEAKENKMDCYSVSKSGAFVEEL